MRILLLILAVLYLSGCAELAYYTHAAGGQLEVISAREPIEDVIENPATNNQTRRQLLLVQQARTFAVKELHLPDSDTFRDYADLKRPWVLWNVYATPEFSLELKQWCYPFIGCQGYRIYFDEDYAKQVAGELEQQGYETYIARSPAYSTRGWFADPVYNPMLHYDDPTLVGILFHELAHEKIYFTDDSQVNESFATIVQYEGLRRWMARRNDSPAYLEYRRDEEREERFVSMVLAFRQELESLYRQKISDEVKRQRKQALFSSLRSKYEELKSQWDGYKGYDHWFNKPLNNARLAPVATYNGYLKAFQAMLKKQDGKLPAFYIKVEELSLMPGKKRRLILEQHLDQ